MRQKIAVFLLIVIMFHSFVLIPKAHATAFQGVVGRIVFRAIAPSTLMAMGSGMSAVIGVGLGVGIGYLIIKSGGITALKNWYTAHGGAEVNPPPGILTQWGSVEVGGGDHRMKTVEALGGSNIGCFNTLIDGANQTTVCGVDAARIAYEWLHGTGTWVPPPPAPYDYNVDMAATQPSFNGTSDVWATPGTAAALAGGAAILTTSTMSDADADKFKTGSGATAASNTGTQATNPAKTDNTVTQGDITNQSMFQQMINYLSNLVGIKTSIDASKGSLDNVALGVNIQTGILDNVGVGINRMVNTMDNVGIGINRMVNSMDNVGTGVAHISTTLDNVSDSIVSKLGISLNPTVTMASRIATLQESLAGKFPFGVASGISVPSGSGGNYDFGVYHLTPSLSFSINPRLAFPGLFSFIRGLLVLLMWCGIIYACVRKVDSL